MCWSVFLPDHDIAQYLSGRIDYDGIDYAGIDYVGIDIAIIKNQN